MQKVRLVLNGKFENPEIAQVISSAIIKFAKKRQFEVTELSMFTSEDAPILNMIRDPLLDPLMPAVTPSTQTDHVNSY